ncbi:M23 family metallopeptidase, partial [Clostridium perfringens]|nr:M23 family metallopeptidase [Clostridium perfringens]
SYNREYEKYYKKINKVNKTSPIHDMKSINERNYRRKSRENLCKYVAKDILLSSILSCFIFFSFFTMNQVENEFLSGLCNKFKEVISTDEYYKELAFSESRIVSAISKGVRNNEELKLVREENKNNNYDEEEKEYSEKENKDIVGFSNFEVIEKSSIDYLRESKVIPFKGSVKELENFDLEGEKLYLNGEIGEVKSLLKGSISEVKKNEETYSVKVKYGEDLEILYHNLGDVIRKEGDSIEEGEVIGNSAKNKKVEGVILQVLSENQYINPEENLGFLGVESSDNK